MLLLTTLSVLSLFISSSQALPHNVLAALQNAAPLKRRVPYNVVNVDGLSGPAEGGSEPVGGLNPPTSDITTVVSISVSISNGITTVTATASPSVETVDATATAILTLGPKIEIVNVEGPGLTTSSSTATSSTSSSAVITTIQRLIEVSPLQPSTSSTISSSTTSSSLSSFSSSSTITVQSTIDVAPVASSTPTSTLTSTSTSNNQSTIELVPLPVSTQQPTSTSLTSISRVTFKTSMSSTSPTTAPPASRTQALAPAVTPQWPKAAEHQPLPPLSITTTTQKSKSYDDGKWHTSYAAWNTTSTSLTSAYPTAIGDGAWRIV